MKNLYLIFFAFIALGCQKEEKRTFISKNYLKEFQSKKTQLFNLDTISFKKIVGEFGTEIFFQRENFEVLKNEKITLELIELYDFKEILYRNINTVTTKNELLETNGVLSIRFKSNGKEIHLKENKNLLVYPPKGKLKSNDIFIAKKDSLDNIKWEKNKSKDTIVVINRGGGVFVHASMHKDSVPSFMNNLKFFKETEMVKDYFFLNSGDLGWINIDKLALIDSKISFSLKDRERFPGFNIYFTYQILNSFIFEKRFKNDLKFDSIPLSGKTWMTIIGEKEGELFYDKIELQKQLSNSELLLRMKKTTNKELEEIITQQKI